MSSAIPPALAHRLMLGATTSKQYILTEDYLAEGALYLEVGIAAFKVFIH